MADDLARFLDSRDLQKVSLIGHNIGGKTAMRFAGIYPDRVKGLISLDTAPIATSPDKIELTKKTLKQIISLNIEGKTKKGALEIVS